ncbi:hypothetical protein [Secundilactobacillus similis]|nr:hypothetical protein [Secundilactobacillus similis]
MGKLLTESSVRQLMRVNKLTDQDQLTLPRGTILTPAARGFLTEHQIKVNLSGTETSEVRIQEAEKPKPNPWLQTIQVTHQPIDFNQLTYYGTPLVHLQSALRDQLLRWLTILGETTGELNQTIVTDITTFVNSLTTTTFEEILTNEEYAVDDLKLAEVKLPEVSTFSISNLQLSLGLVADALANYLTVQPDLKQSAYYQAVITWQTMIQDWTQSLIESR